MRVVMTQFSSYLARVRVKTFASFIPANSTMLCDCLNGAIDLMFTSVKQFFVTSLNGNENERFVMSDCQHLKKGVFFHVCVL